MIRLQQNHFKSLAPANDIKGVESYIEWLDGIVSGENSDTFGNIAMTGDLGIGKSSVVRTFERQKHYKFIYLSASDLGYRFDEKQPDAEAEQKRNEEIQRRLEKDLLVQLIALCRRSDIPKSRFRMVPENGSPFLLKAYSFLCGISALCGGMLAVNRLTAQTVYPGSLSLWPWIGLAGFLGLSVWFWSNRLFQNYRLSKLSFGTDKTYSASAEINPQTLEPETLDTNLHEILYLFERLAKKKHLFKKRRAVFIIEDLDRYPSDICIPILTKLRQINSMLNNRYRNQHGGYGLHYKFIYLLNDRIFDASESSKTISEKDPYKFFDVIIPVLPKLGFTNSSETIRQTFENYSIESNFISEIGKYIYDYRKLRDIENEFFVYYMKFKKMASNTSLLAFVTYKIFFKEKYDLLFKKDEDTGEPQNGLLKCFLNHDFASHNSVGFEKSLESYFMKDLFVILQTDSATIRKWLKNYPANSAENENLININLSGLNLSSMELDHISLIGARLVNTNLQNTNLSFSNLKDANLHSANLSSATLSHAILSNADLQSANLAHADLTEAILIGAKLNRAHLFHATLLDAKLNGADLTSANLNGARLSRAILTEAILDYAFINTASFVHANLKKAQLKWTHLANASFQHAILTGASLINANLVKAYLTDTDLTDAKLNNSNLSRANLTNATLTNAVLIGTNMTKARLQNAILHNVNLANTKLVRACLIGTDFKESYNLSLAKWKKARYCLSSPNGLCSFAEKCEHVNEFGIKECCLHNSHTNFPSRFNPQANQMIKVDINDTLVPPPVPAEEAPVSESDDSTNKKSASAPPPKKHKKKKRK